MAAYDGFEEYRGNSGTLVYVDETSLIVYNDTEYVDKQFKVYYSSSEVVESFLKPDFKFALLKFSDGVKMQIRGNVHSEKLEAFLGTKYPSLSDISGMEKVKIPEIRKTTGEGR